MAHMLRLMTCEGLMICKDFGTLVRKNKLGLPKRIRIVVRLSFRYGICRV